MQQRLRTLKADRIARPRGLRRPVAAAVVVALAGALAAGCSPSWVGSWAGTADLGPVNAYTIELSLADADGVSGAVVTAPDGRVQRHKLCSQSVQGRQITFEIDTGRSDCSAGPGAERLRFEGAVGARLIHGIIYRGKERVGFFRAFPKRPPEPEVQAG